MQAGFLREESCQLVQHLLFSILKRMSITDGPEGPFLAYFWEVLEPVR